jgi:hypothetical protein
MNHPIFPILGVILIVAIAYILSNLEERNRKNKK